ncbi:UDP-glucosyltransferase 2 [Hyalella azteca]|uniref:UDP-glucosyltransferase 2 n=1 Tax=Hyalella azteca TaxID=294128 RepID=A0A8B7NKT2_HYAAZ|nr:UDP-glucosyltransferase 2 [Hyalella azteca]
MKGVLCFFALFVCRFYAVHCESGATQAGLREKAKGPLGKVLFVAVVGSKSHKNFYYGVSEALANAGYEVTILTPYQPSRKIKNVREIVLESNDIAPHMANVWKDGSFAPIWQLTKFGPELCAKALAADEYSEVLKEKFDIAFVSVFFCECFLGHINAMNIPFVFVNPAEMIGPFSGARMGNPTFPTIDENPMLSFPRPMSFVHRFISSLSEVMLGAMTTYFSYCADSVVRSQGLLPPGTPYLPDIYRNASLMIANSFRLAEHPRPYMPNILLLGGIHLKTPKPLEKDLNDWVESSGDAGFIFFSLGSAVRASDMPAETINLLLEVFKSLEQKVLWKFNLPDLGVDLPPNVRLTTWAPQQDLLGHPKMRLFITHGGLFSTQEATYHGVPVLGLPVFGDQPGNMLKAEAQGWGLKLDWDELSHDRLRSAILRLIDDPVARQRVATIGALMRDRPTSPGDDIVWWTGYIIRTGGARHLQSGAVHVSWYQLYNVDVWAVVVLFVLLILWVEWKIVLFIYRRIVSKPASDVSKKRKKH